MSAPTGYTRASPAASARRTTSLTIAAESSAGSVFGMHATAVKPPATAAAVPVAIVSLCVWPGSRRWTCMSMKPGRDDRVGRVDDARAGVVEVLADARHEPVLDQHVAQRVDPLQRIDQPAAADQRFHAGTGAPLTSRSSTAMRTKTPLCTCAT